MVFVGESGRAGGGRRKEAEGPSHSGAEPACAASFPCMAGGPVEAEVWMEEERHPHRKGIWTFARK